MMLLVNGKRFPVWGVSMVENFDGDYDISIEIDGGGEPFFYIVEGVVPKDGNLLSVETWLTWRGYSKPLHE